MLAALCSCAASHLTVSDKRVWLRSLCVSVLVSRQPAEDTEMPILLNGALGVGRTVAEMVACVYQLTIDVDSADRLGGAAAREVHKTPAAAW